MDNEFVYMIGYTDSSAANEYPIDGIKLQCVYRNNRAAQNRADDLNRTAKQEGRTHMYYYTVKTVLV